MKNVILNNKLVRSVVLASSLVLSVFSAQANVILSFSESDVEVNLNESFTLSLYADTEFLSDSFFAFIMDVDFDNSVLSFDGFTRSSSFIANAPILPINGVYFDPSFATLSAFGSDILLGTLEFTTIGLGSRTIETISESFLSLIPVIAIGSESAFTNVNVVGVSAPGTIVIFGLALAMLVRRRV
jgi:hypothetical protein